MNVERQLTLLRMAARVDPHLRQAVEDVETAYREQVASQAWNFQGICEGCYKAVPLVEMAKDGQPGHVIDGSVPDLCGPVVTLDRFLLLARVWHDEGAEPAIEALKSQRDEAKADAEFMRDLINAVGMSPMATPEARRRLHEAVEACGVQLRKVGAQ